MAIDTKPNLSSNKFEQCVGDSLTLSGNTNVHGTFIIQSGGTVSILSNKGQGKILVSDASGVGTWQINNSVSGATNGLTKIGQKIKLGGDLTGDTIINTANNDLSLCSSTYTNRGILLNQTSDELKFLWADTGNTCMSCAGFTPANISLLSQYAGGGCSAGISMVHADNRICFDSAGTVRTYHDTSGLWYTSDYSGSVSARWIPDAAWVTGQTGGGGGIGWSNLANGSTIAGCGTVTSGSTICRNTVYGVNALKNVTSGDNNIAIGYLALSANTTGIGNIGIGGSALYSNINGHYNIAQGMESLYNNISGQYNVGIGYVSLWCNTTGCDNVAVGQAALNGNVSGCYNVALGCSALLVNSSGNNNVGIGKRTLYNNDTGIMNIAIGDSSLFGNTTGSYNVAISECALYCNKTGLNNIAIGDFAMFYNTGGTCNIGIGLEALYSNISGNGNISIGVDNLNNSISGCDNIALGNLNANSIVSGSNNTFIGKYVGHNETGSYKLHIGSNSSSVNSKSLIYGEFDNEKLCIRGQTYMSGLTNSTKSNVIYYDISTNELSYGIVSGGTGGSLSEFTITGDSSSTGFTINHAKNKQFVGVEIIRNSSPYPTVYTSTYRTNANCVCITFDTAPANGLEYKILVSS